MKNREALKIEGPARDMSRDASSFADGLSGSLSTIFVISAAGAAMFAVLASGSSEPVLLTVLAIFAMLGAFFVFGLLSGHVRLGTRLPDGDLLKAAADAAIEPLVISQRDSVPVYWNAAMDGLFGRSQAGPVAAMESLFAGDAPATQALYRLMRAAERGEARSEDIALASRISAGGKIVLSTLEPRQDGDARQPCWLRVSVRPFVARQDTATAAEQTTWVSWQIADVTADRNREAARIATLEASLAAFDTMPAGFIAVAADGTIGHVNASFESWLGHERGTILQRKMRLSDIAGLDGSRQLAMLALASDSDHRTVDLDLSRNDGRIVSLTLFVEPAGNGFTLTAINRSSGALLGLSGANARSAPFFQSSPFGIATLDGDGRISSCNTAFSRMVLDGRPSADALALDALCRTADDTERQQIAEGLAQIISGRGNVAPVEITAGDQKQFMRRIYMAPIATEPGQDAAALYVIDVTEQKTLEHRFAQAQKMEAVGKLAGGIAHDFNNVLTAIIGFSDLLLQTHRPTDPAYKDIRNIQSAANRAAGLVASLLGFSRKQTQQVSALQLGEFTSDMSPVLKTLVGEKIDLKIQSERDLWYVSADRDQVYNVILNLCTNARDAMPTGGVLSLKTRNVTERESQKMTDVVGFTAGEYVLIEVADSGTGMSPDVMAKIFEPFFTTKSVGKGTGLGLASVYGIVKQSRGFIQPESEIGKGTTFKVYLPRHHVELEDAIEVTNLNSPAQAASRKPVKAADLTGTGRVLLVEDEIEVRQFAVRALKRQGYTVLEAGDGVEALEVMNTNEPVDIVVSDVVMPEMDGPTLFKELRRRNPAIKVIFVSGYPNEAFRETLGTEDFAFLPKPFSLPQLAAKVKEELAK